MSLIFSVHGKPKFDPALTRKFIYIICINIKCIDVKNKFIYNVIIVNQFEYLNEINGLVTCMFGLMIDFIICTTPAH